ncbi:MAG: FecR family protein, partial [Pricia sp.]
MKNTISKLLMGTITEEELLELRDWLNDPKNQSELETYVRDYHDLNLSTLRSDVDKAYNKVIHHIEREQRPIRKLIPNWAKYAAAIVLLFGIALLYQQDLFSSKTKHVIVPKDEPITLKLDDGTLMTIDVSETTNVNDVNGNTVGMQKRNQIKYSEVKSTQKLVYNTLIVPKGKQFELELSDGTAVHLNAGSSLRYPVHFLPSEPRKVFLVGEAYFDVSKNESRTFVVNVDALDVEVLGTEFNISAYEENQS